MRQLFIVFLMIGIIGCNGLSLAQEQTPSAQPPAPLSDPSGSKTGGAQDVAGASANAPSADELQKLAVNEPLAAKLADTVGHNRIAINMVWTLVCGFLVMFMQAGFAMAETGFTQAKNAGHTMARMREIY